MSLRATLVFVEQQGAGGIHPGVVELPRAERTPRPIALLLALVERHGEMRRCLRPQRVTSFAALACREHRVVDGRGVDRVMTGEPCRIIRSVVDRLHGRGGFEHGAQAFNLDLAERIDDGDAQAVTFAVGELHQGVALTLLVPPVGSLDVERDSGYGGEPRDERRQVTLAADEV